LQGASEDNRTCGWAEAQQHAPIRPQGHTNGITIEVMDPRTFIKPADIPVAPVPRVGEPAPDPPGPPVEPPGQVICFLRHTGCPFAEATLLELSKLHTLNPSVTAVAVGHAPAQAAIAWRSKVGGAEGVVCIDDPSRHLYAQWGLGLTDASHFAGRDSLSSVGRLFGQGIRNRHPAGTRWQGAGSFAVDERGIVRWRHLPKHAGDLPDLVQAFGSLTHSKV